MEASALPTFHQSEKKNEVVWVSSFKLLVNHHHPPTKKKKKKKKKNCSYVYHATALPDSSRQPTAVVEGESSPSPDTPLNKKMVTSTKTTTRLLLLLLLLLFFIGSEASSFRSAKRGYVDISDINRGIYTLFYVFVSIL